MHTFITCRLREQKLLQAQEEERKYMLRELNDEIGQMITAFRMELANLDPLRMDPGAVFAEHLQEAKSLAEKTLHLVRNLAMGLQPSMLDELGLGPALQWQARVFSRHSGISVMVAAEGNLEKLPGGFRTCVYRVVQESLTNCARHAHATSVRVAVKGNNAPVHDHSGQRRGFDPRAAGRSLGLIGLEERVREMGGKISFSSQFKKGTIVQVEIPLSREATA